MLLQNAETVRLATAQGGSVSLTSLKPGARFVFFLPHYIRRLDTTLTTPSISHRRSYRPLSLPVDPTIPTLYILPYLHCGGRLRTPRRY